MMKRGKRRKRKRKRRRKERKKVKSRCSVAASLGREKPPPPVRMTWPSFEFGFSTAVHQRLLFVLLSSGLSSLWRLSLTRSRTALLGLSRRFSGDSFPPDLLRPIFFYFNSSLCCFYQLARCARVSSDIRSRSTAHSSSDWPSSTCSLCCFSPRLSAVLT